MSMFFRFPLVLFSFPSTSLSICKTVILESLSSKSNPHIPSWFIEKSIDESLDEPCFSVSLYVL